MRSTFAVFITGVLLAGSVNAQEGATRQPPPRRTMMDDPFFTLFGTDRVGPNQLREASGMPGPAYWQQRADYSIAATLDTATRSLSGAVTIRYTNNSPDTLRFVWLQLDQNIYRKESMGSLQNYPGSRNASGGFIGGYELSGVKVGTSSVTPHIDDTMMQIDLPAPLPPKGVITISMTYKFRIPRFGSDRMGRDSVDKLYGMAQWYPRMAVYDDVRGWNTDPYLGEGEFYLEYGDIDYAITVPAGFIVAGSGVLQNPLEVLSAPQRERFTRASKSTTVVQIVTATEAVARPANGTKTWKFVAKNVRDVAWATSPDFRWDAVSTGPIPGNATGVITQALYRPTAGAQWEHAAEMTQWTIKHYSETFCPYPYPQATTVAGPAGGMEYPMFSLLEGADDRELFEVLNHEHGHEWFPMVVGSNERRYAWMDEGINTYINQFAADARYPQEPANPREGATARANVSIPLMTAPDHSVGMLGVIGYEKPSDVLFLLRNHVLTPQSFDRAFREYIRRWAFKHPTPADFFRTIENVTGHDLQWFWRQYFYTSDVVDIGVDTVANAHAGEGLDSSAVQRGDTLMTVIMLRRMTPAVFPVRMRVKYANGSTHDLLLPVDVWERDRFAFRMLGSNPVVGVRLWPMPGGPDSNAANDTWGDAPPADPATKMSAGGLPPISSH